MWKLQETHIILSRWCHCDHDVTLSDALPGCSFLGHGDEHGQVAGPGPQHRGVGHRHVNVVAVLGEVRLPNGLNTGTQETETHSKSTFFNFRWLRHQASDVRLFLPKIKEINEKRHKSKKKKTVTRQRLVLFTPCQQSCPSHPSHWEWWRWRWWASLHSRWAESSKATCRDTLSGRCSSETD